ncbi:CocE/NonD family hydrolase [Frigidibacter sp.]|uniref:CocE/NonD family hydrolase n=1 Tax=Frigidibacter sp. TaxID=2586418 RepID=UPI002735496B|nr:CocE/NonD family hydrolase [Frigidibacter sp.]MDP3339308.1 CocE/NonD family hydrolase [Frigidibacter sp.]
MEWLNGTSGEPPSPYRPAPEYDGRIDQPDVRVPMRDGVSLCVDVYRPETADPLPALLAFAPYNKDLSGREYASVVGPQPPWSPLWAGEIEAGDTDFLTARGYVHVIGTARGNGKSEGGGNPETDLYDLIEWIAAQPWCDGNVGMIGISAFGAAQLQAAALQPPSLKAIFPYDPGPAYREFRDRNPGGVVHAFPLIIDAGSVAHTRSGPPGALSEADEAAWREAMANPDYIAHSKIYNILAMKGQKAPIFFRTLIQPFDTAQAVEAAEKRFSDLKIPAYFGTGWYAQTYKSHFQGTQNWYRNTTAPKRLMFTGNAQVDRPFRAFHNEILRWYDHWLKGRDTGIMDEPPVRMYVTGANRWLTAADWPLPEAMWTEFYLDSWERLRREPFAPRSRDGSGGPDAFVQMPATQTRTIQKLRYLSEPLGTDMLSAGPVSATLFASIDCADTNWFVTIKDVGPDWPLRMAQDTDPVQAAEHVVSRGWLKASYRALDEDRSTPWKPWHKLTREARQAVTPGEVVEYRIELMSFAHLFRRGHRLCVEISSADFTTGIGGGNNVEYIPYHIGRSETVLHKVYFGPDHPSHVLLPLVPLGAIHDAGDQT